MRKHVVLLILTAITLLWFVEDAFTQTDSASPYALPGIGAKPGAFISPPGESPESPREPMSPPPYIRKSVRDLAPIYLMEKNGELIPALNWTSEELDLLLQRLNDNQRQTDLPDYICESLTLTGVQKGETAELLLKMQFTVPQKPVVRIPLQLNGVILLEAPQCSAGEFLAPQSGGGYVLFLKSEGETVNSEEQKPKEEQAQAAEEQTEETAPEQNPEESDSSEEKPAAKSENPDSSSIVSESNSSSGTSQKHEITLKIQVPLQKNQSTYTLNMKLPKALFSQIFLETPFSSVETRASSHAVVQPTESLDDGKRTRIGAYSLGSEFQLQWQASELQESNSRILESFTDIHIDIRPGLIFYTANMRLQYANQPPSEFILNLPPSAELLPSQTNEYVIERLQESNSQSDVQNAVKIHLNNVYQSSAKLTFQARLPIEQATSLRWQDLMGFGIRGSVRQNGCIGVNVDKSYQVIWNPGQYVSRVDELPDTYEGEYQYAFLFSEQPCSLMARIVAGRTRFNVQPQYKVFIGEEEMRLDVSWIYNIRGGQANWLDVDLNGWQLRSVKDIGPENAFTSESREDSGRVSARLAQPATGTVNMKMTLYTSIDPGAKDITFSLPQPRVNSSDEDIVLSPGILYVVSATNVKLNPSMDKMEKLVKQNYSSSEMQKAESGELFCYRVDDPEAQFKSSLTVLPQQIEVQSAAKATITGMQCLVKQRFDFSVLYKPVSQAAFISSNALAELADLKFTLNGKELNIRKTTENGNTRITAIIDEPKIGSFVIEASYTLPLNEEGDDNLANVKVPLVSYDNPDANEEDRIVACKSVQLGVDRTCELISVTSEELDLRDEKQIDLSALQSMELIDSENEKSRNQQTIDGFSTLSSPFSSFLSINQMSSNDAASEKTAAFEDDSHYSSYFWSLTPRSTQETNNASLIILVKRRKGMVWDSLTVDKAWIQTFLTPTRRQDSASFRFIATTPQITLVLPPEVDMGSLQVLLDSNLTDQFRPEHGQRFVITIPADNQVHIIEISYYFMRSSRGFKKEDIQLPYIEESKWTRWLYWSLCVPNNIHLLAPPKALNAEYSWQRQGPFFRRNSVYAYSALEEWSEGHNLPEPPQGTNVYLFSGFGQIKNVEVTLVNRSVLAVFSSLIVLILGLIFLYVKRLSKFWMLTILAIAFCFVSFWEPEITLTVLQASALGCALLALTFLFKKKPPSLNRSDTTVAQRHTMQTHAK